MVDVDEIVLTAKGLIKHLDQKPLGHETAALSAALRWAIIKYERK